MKRVAMIVQSLYPQDGRVRREAEALEAAGVPVDVICQRTDKQDPVEDLGLVRAYRIAPQRDKESLLRYIAVSLHFARAAFIQLRKLAPVRDYSLVQVHNMPDFLVYSAIPGKRRGLPVVLDLHDLSVELFGSKWKGPKARILLPMVRMAERKACRFADALITTSSGFKDKLIERGNPPDKITLVLNTPDTRVFRPRREREYHPIRHSARIIYHGTVAARFDLLNAIDTVAHLQERIPNSTLQIFGRYDRTYRTLLENRIDILGLHGKVQLNGWRSLEEVSRLVEESDFGIVPYRSDPFMNLALSTKTFEYVTAGLPVVASRLEALTALFDDDCLQYAEPSDPADFARQIANLCDNPERRRAIVERAKSVLPKISAQVMQERYLNLINRLAGCEAPDIEYTDSISMDGSAR